MSRPSQRPAIAALSTRDQAPATADLAQRLRDALAASIRALGTGAAGDEPALTIPRSPQPIAPAQMARVHPGSARDRLQACAMYQRCLQHYRALHGSADAPAAAPADAAAAGDDVGTALASFVAANLEALHGIDAAPEVMPRLGRQLVAVVRSSPAWQRAPLRERQAYVEQLGILAVVMADYSVRAKRQGAAAIAHVQQGARGYLRQLLGLDPEALTLDADGLALRSTALAA